MLKINPYKLCLFLLFLSLFKASVSQAMLSTDEQATFLPDDIEYEHRRYFLPKAPEHNCANSVLADLKKRFKIMNIPFRESGDNNLPGTFYYPRDTNAKDALGRVLLPNHSTIRDATPGIDKINFSDLGERTKRFFQFERAKTHSILSHVRQLDFNSLIFRYANVLGPELMYEIGADPVQPRTRVDRNHFHIGIGMHDGGNSLVLHNTKGNRRLIVGETEVIYNTIFLRARGFFSDNTRQKNFSFTSAQSIRLQELLGRHDIDSWLAEHSARLLSTLDGETKKRLYNTTYFLGYNAGKKEGDEGDTIIGMFLAQQEFVKAILLPLDYSVQPNEVVVVPQIFYHLDLYVAPIAQGKLLLPDFQDMIKNLDELASQNERGNAHSKAAAEIFASMRDETRNLLASFAITEKLTEMEKVLVLAGFDVVTAPVIAAASRDRTISALNPVYGINPTTKKPYWFTAGISLGGKKQEILASKLLMDHLHEILITRAFKESNVEFAFVGANSRARRGQDAFSDCRLLHEKHAGLHCLTADIK